MTMQCGHCQGLGCPTCSGKGHFGFEESVVLVPATRQNPELAAKVIEDTKQIALKLAAELRLTRNDLMDDGYLSAATDVERADTCIRSLVDELAHWQPRAREAENLSRAMRAERDALRDVLRDWVASCDRSPQLESLSKIHVARAREQLKKGDAMGLLPHQEGALSEIAALANDNANLRAEIALLKDQHTQRLKEAVDRAYELLNDKVSLRTRLALADSVCQSLATWWEGAKDSQTLGFDVVVKLNEWREAEGKR